MGADEEQRWEYILWVDGVGADRREAPVNILEPLVQWAAVFARGELTVADEVQKA